MAEENKKPKILSLAIRDKNVLYSAYMSFLLRGGLFIPTQRQYTLGENVQVILKLLDDPVIIETLAKVVWITPKGAAKIQGIGVEFIEEKLHIKEKIEGLLGGMLDSDKTTHTM